MPANDQLCSWDVIAAEVAAGRMMWSGAAQSGTVVPTWSQWQAAVMNDGTNPAGLAATQCPRYDALLARAVVMQPPATATASNGGAGTLMADWTAPASGPAPASYDIQYYSNGSPLSGIKNVPAGTLSDSQSGYPASASGYFTVRSKASGGAVSAWLQSNTVTVTGGA